MSPSPSDNEVRNLTVLAYTNRFTWWHYRCLRVRLAIEPGRFDFAAIMLKPGDCLHVTADDGAAILVVRESVDGSAVRVSWLALSEFTPGALTSDLAGV